LASPLVEKIAVVEGCVRKNEHAGSEAGLSTDNTREVVEKATAEDETDRIIYRRHGWAKGKTELQNKCLELLEEQAPSVAYYILAGADEIWDPPNLERLAAEIKKHGNPDIPLCEFVHFWKRPDMRAKGSMWDTWMHRVYRNHGKGMKFQFHAGPPLKPDGSKLKTEVKVKGVKIYHYTAMKDRKDVLDRLKFYQERDKKGKDTWTGWTPGKPTQWTHNGGTAEPYDGKHPAAIAADVWALTPDLPAPETKVFIPSAKSERNKVKGFVLELARNCPVTVIGLTNPRWPGVQFRKISNLKSMVDGIELLVNANRNLVLSPLAKQNVLFAYEPMPECKPLWSGWRIVCLDEEIGKTWSGKARKIAHPAQMLLDVARFPTVGIPRVRTQGPTMGGSVGKPTTPGKLGKAGKVRIVSTRPLVAAWSFVNPMDFKFKGKRSHIGYEIALASGSRTIRTKRTITRTPDLAPGDGFQVEIVLPMDLPPSEYVVRFDFRTRDRWGSELGVKPLEIMYSIDSKKRIWVR